MTFTAAQKRAITTRGHDVLISAGAGSGKTAVLSERVLDHVRRGTPLEKLVVLTFTNAAAREMKSRIRTKLIEENTPEATRALASLKTAHVRTFDSYALAVLKRYGHIIGVAANVTIGEPTALSMREATLLERLFNQRYEAGDEAFLRYVAAFENKDDATLRAQINHFHEQVSLHADFDAALDHAFPATGTPRFEEAFSVFLNLVDETVERVVDIVNDMRNGAPHETVEAHADAVMDGLAPLKKADGYDALHGAVDALRLPTLRTPNKALRDAGMDGEVYALDAMQQRLKKALDTLRTLTRYSREAHREAFVKAHEHFPTIKALVRDFDLACIREQTRTGRMRFSTVARLAIGLVRDYPEVRDELKRETAEVMIDEYQDTNRLQETFVSLITSDNTYQVGDIKQSIYRFRHAEPALFTDKLKRYGEGAGEVIDFDLNFRSRAGVLSGVNALFAQTMDEAIGGVDYVDGQRLKPGNTVFSQLPEDAANTGLWLAAYDEKDIISYRERGLRDDDIEAQLVADDIARRVGSMSIVDGQTLRPLRYDDVAILINVSTPFDIYRKAFASKGVPLTVWKNVRFAECVDVDVYRQFLRLTYALLDDEYYRAFGKHAFMGVARSFVVESSDEDAAKQLSTWPAQRPRDPSFADERFVEVFNALFAIARVAREDSLGEVFSSLVDAFDMEAALVRIPDTEAARGRLAQLEAMIASLADEGFDLAALVHHFDALAESDDDLEFMSADPSHDGGVRLMTIHKSKGLEFPVVYVPSLQRGFRRTTMKNYAYDTCFGAVMPHDDEGLRESFLFDVHKARLKADDVSERLRVLYVALTRAKELCVLPYLKKPEAAPWHTDEEGVVKAFERREYGSYHEVISSAMTALEGRVMRWQVEGKVDVDYRRRLTDRRVVDSARSIDKTYASPVIAAPVTRSRYSADEIELPDAASRRVMARGNRMHELFELIDFARPIEPQVHALSHDAMERSMVRAFFESDIYRHLDIENVYKEFPIVDEDDEGERSGFIDLLLETKDAFVIVDYKLSVTEKTSYHAQIEGYASTLRKMTSKPIEGYLYSLSARRFVKVL